MQSTSEYQNLKNRHILVFKWFGLQTVQTRPKIKLQFKIRSGFQMTIQKLDCFVQFSNDYYKMAAKNGPVLG
jgi:hypothetical protein